MTSTIFKFRCEEARSSDAKCRGQASSCFRKIQQDELRIAYLKPSRCFDGRELLWYHVDCFFQEFQDQVSSISQFDGFFDLPMDKQGDLARRIAGKGQEISLPDDDSPEGEQNLLKQQNDDLFELQKLLKDHTKRTDLIHLLKINGQYVPTGRPEKLRHVADVILFGALLPCDQCVEGPLGRFMFSNGLYKCMGFRFGKCDNTAKTPPRKTAIIPDSLHASIAAFCGKYDARVLPVLDEDVDMVMATSKLSLNDSEENSIREVFEKHVLKYGNVVDPTQEYAANYHVYEENVPKRKRSVPYAVKLIKTDVNTNMNAFYELKLLEIDVNAGEKKYKVSRAWGRIGTERRDHVLSNSLDLEGAKQFFRATFNEKTHNIFGNEFKAKRGRYDLINVDYETNSKLENDENESILSPAVDNLMQMLFDENSFNHMILEFHLDINKMPLGKLSKEHLAKASKCLKEIKQMIENNKTKPINLKMKTEEYYTLIPHDFGDDVVPIINSLDRLNKEGELMALLRNVEIIYTILNEVEGYKMNRNEFNYSHLNMTIEALDHQSDEFQLIETYVRNTHSDIHKIYQLSVVEVFRIARDGDSERYAPFEQFDNRKLLFHGSRLPNFVGILKNGLVIDSPNIPTIPGMFGRGIYFADVVSKSANYCHAGLYGETGLLLLCQVALGTMKDCLTANSSIKLRPGKDSVRGIGKMEPNPDESYVRADGVEIPLGKLIANPEVATGLEHNEYIVYNENQLKMEYLIQVQFTFGNPNE